MSAKYSKRDREDAARILSAAAANHGRPRRHHWRSMTEIAMALGASTAAIELATAAHEDFFSQLRPTLDVAEYYAEPESMIRTGWTP